MLLHGFWKCKNESASTDTSTPSYSTSHLRGYMESLRSVKSQPRHTLKRYIWPTQAIWFTKRWRKRWGPSGISSTSDQKRQNSTSSNDPFLLAIHLCRLISGTIKKLLWTSIFWGKEFGFLPFFLTSGVFFKLYYNLTVLFLFSIYLFWFWRFYYKES